MSHKADRSLFISRSSYDLESSLSLSPPEELAMFSARHKYDVIVIYDRSSSSIPTNAPPSTASDAQRVLWNLNNAIYEKEFSKSLKRQPILLKGGWEAWEKKIGEKGIVREGVQPTKPPARLLEDTRPRANSDEFSRAEAKKANRKVTVVPGANSPAYVRPCRSTTKCEQPELTVLTSRPPLHLQFTPQAEQATTSPRARRTAPTASHPPARSCRRASRCRRPRCTDPARGRRTTTRYSRPRRIGRHILSHT